MFSPNLFWIQKDGNGNFPEHLLWEHFRRHCAAVDRGCESQNFRQSRHHSDARSRVRPSVSLSLRCCGPNSAGAQPQRRKFGTTSSELGGRTADGRTDERCNAGGPSSKHSPSSQAPRRQAGLFEHVRSLSIPSSPSLSLRACQQPTGLPARRRIVGKMILLSPLRK